MSAPSTVLGSEPPALIGRDLEQGRLHELLLASRSGRGAAVVLEGSPGIGKTALLRDLRARAEREGLLVLSWRGGELERSMPFGMARRLLTPALRGMASEEVEGLLAGAAAPAAPVLGFGAGGRFGGDLFAVLDALYWVCSTLAEQRPLALLVDDLHWCDQQSLRWLSYLARRLEDLPVLLTGTARPAQPGTERDLLDALVGDEDVELLALRPLDPGSVAMLAELGLGAKAEHEFVEACVQVAAGNPLILRELLQATIREGIPPTAAAAPRLRPLGAVALATSILVRVARVGPAARELATAVAVLGANVPLRQAAGLMGLELEAAAGAADRLRDLRVLEDGDRLEFSHPLMREAVYQDLPPSRGGQLHRAAARLLAQEGVEVDGLVPHLLAGEPQGDGWVVDRLREAAQAAVGKGAPDAAVVCLQRALAEPPSPEARGAVHFELGLAAIRVSPFLAAEHLQAALSLTEGREARGPVALVLAKSLGFCDRPAEGVRVLEQAIAELGEGELRLALEAEHAVWSLFSVELSSGVTEPGSQLERRAAPLLGRTAAEQSLLTMLAWARIAAGAPIEKTLPLAERAIARGLSFVEEPGFETATIAASCFFYADRLEVAQALFDVGIEEMRAAGQVVLLPFAHAHRAHIALRAGRLLEAEVEARAGVQIAAEMGPAQPAWWYAMVDLVQVLVARGLLEEISRVVAEQWPPDRLPEAVIYPLPRLVRGELRLARGELEAGLEDLMAVGEWCRQRGFQSPSWAAWRSLAAPALATLGREGEAQALSREDVGRARRSGSPWAIGKALRAAALVGPREQRLGLLQESVAVLDPSPCAIELCASLVELGAELRRTNRRSAAREPLSRALDLARRGGSLLLGERAEVELRATGARPRRAMLAGLESLTASERRVAELVSQRLSNREIAQRLFVTPKTVENHLGHVYQKLDLQGQARARERIAERLREPDRALERTGP